MIHSAPREAPPDPASRLPHLHHETLLPSASVSQGLRAPLVTPIRPPLRAYIYHLVDAHEMLAEVLLEIHNAHHMLLFFNAMRAAIKQGAFGEFAAFHRSRSRGQNIGQLLAVS